MAGRNGRPSSLTQTKLSRWWVIPIAPTCRESIVDTASLRAAIVDCHHSSAFCSCHPGWGRSNGKALLPSATMSPPRSHTTAFVAVVEQSIPMTYEGALKSGHIPELRGQAIRTLLHVFRRGLHILPLGDQLAQFDGKHIVCYLRPGR